MRDLFDYLSKGLLDWHEGQGSPLFICLKCEALGLDGLALGSTRWFVHLLLKCQLVQDPYYNIWGPLLKEVSTRTSATT